MLPVRGCEAGLQLRLHDARESGAANAAARGEAVPELGGKHGALDLRVRGNEMRLRLEVGAHQLVPAFQRRGPVDPGWQLRHPRTVPPDGDGVALAPQLLADLDQRGNFMSIAQV